ncbi:ABC-2 type transport system ATP-binding protein [Streptomyces sp. WMMB 714]|uniref:ATP-binding cassette domain-containing protein n=1 Tax=Streptomyces sp. WMMB 714 TaxID=1286822 RepID=UPI0005F86DEE|nr:ATP-binding cassette domain-containing protein [Streptomyces sp. WMMB 714]SCK20790.1 ABC-2 type transport system ATP-binding protein [Streptomyces sp. WMMB 714]
MIEVQKLTKRYGETLAVDGLSFQVRPGRVTGFLGPNGAGKSTTMRAMIGLDRPTSGQVLIDGRRYEQIAQPLRKVGALLEAKALHGGRTAYGHLLGLARSNRIPEARVGEVLETVGLSATAKKRAGGFSLGMAQRLGVAAALLGDPEVLLFDEPVNGLDPEGILWIRELMKKLAGEGRTVFVSSHLMSEMALTAEHLIVIGQGRLLADTTVEDFIARNSRSYIHIRTPEPERMRDVLAGEGIRTDNGPEGVLEALGTTLETVGKLASKHQVTVYEISPRTASLEEAFMQLTADAVDFRADLEVR